MLMLSIAAAGGLSSPAAVAGESTDIRAVHTCFPGDAGIQRQPRLCLEAGCLVKVLITLNVLKETRWQHNCEGAVTHRRPEGEGMVPSALSSGDAQGPGRSVRLRHAPEEKMQ